MIWLVPLALLVVFAVPVAITVRRVAREAGALRRELTLLAELREPIEALQIEAREVASGVTAVRGRARPAATLAP
ncbi:MAG: hypothetical protein M3Q68_07925 [Actinomycetota bacterium]|nr:hypothetical protein [Actinomycetota bacterium]